MEVEVSKSMMEIIWQDSLSIIVKHISIVNLVRDKREEYKYIYKTFEYNNINYLIFFFYYKYLFNIDLNYLKIRIISILIRKMVNKGIVYNK